MATFLDLGAMNLLEYFMPVFLFIFIFVILYAIIDKTGILGKNKTLNIILSLVVSLTVLFSGSGLELINFVTPWFAVIIVISVISVLLLSMFLKEGIDVIGMKKPIAIIAMIFAGIVLVIGITQVFGPVFTPYAEGADPNWSVLRTLFHPRLLGAFLILLIVNIIIKNLVEK